MTLVCERQASVLSPSEAAKRLNVSVETIRRLCRLGEIRAMRIGRQWRISEEALEEHLTRGLDAPRETFGPNRDWRVGQDPLGAYSDPPEGEDDKDDPSG